MLWKCWACTREFGPKEWTPLIIDFLELNLAAFEHGNCIVGMVYAARIYISSSRAGPVNKRNTKSTITMPKRYDKLTLKSNILPVAFMFLEMILSYCCGNFRISCRFLLENFQQDLMILEYLSIVKEYKSTAYCMYHKVWSSFCNFSWVICHIYTYHSGLLKGDWAIA